MSEQGIPPDQGTAHESVSDEGRVGRFSRGREVLPPSASALHRGRFSEGLEQLPESPVKRRRGGFSDGLVGAERLSAEERRRGGFADGQRRPDAP